MNAYTAIINIVAGSITFFNDALQLPLQMDPVNNAVNPGRSIKVWQFSIGAELIFGMLLIGAALFFTNLPPSTELILKH